MAFTSLVEVAIETVLVGDVQCMYFGMIGKVRMGLKLYCVK